MKWGTRTMLALLSAVLLLAAGLAAQKTDSAQALLRAATDKAVVDGDLNGAIKQYQTIVDTFKTDRAVVATALVQMAECYQKLGDAESRKIYERVVREYADQKEAVTLARVRLGGVAQPRLQANTLAEKPRSEVWRIPIGGDEPRKLDDTSTLNLSILNLMFARSSSVHPDGRRIAYTVYEQVPRRNEAWVLENFLPAPSATQ
jgi:hypothetical protein